MNPNLSHQFHEPFSVHPSGKAVMLGGHILPAAKIEHWEDGGISAHIPLENGHIAYLDTNPRRSGDRFTASIPDTHGDLYSAHPNDQYEDFSRSARHPISDEDAFAYGDDPHAIAGKIKAWAQWPAPASHSLEFNRDYINQWRHDR